MKETRVMNRIYVVACLAAIPMLAIAACAAGTTKNPTDTGGAGGDGGMGESSSASSGGAGHGGSACEKEICDGIDNDCNGMIDDGFGPESCGLGACMTMVESKCKNGLPVACVPLKPAPAETCNGTDDDCDGTVDEDCSCINGKTQTCYTGPAQTQGIGSCHDGMQSCIGGVWGPCLDDVTPIAEQCDGLDNDCDGVMDNGNPGGGNACMTGKPGVCASGTEACQGSTVVCVQNTQPSADICDGLDNDCNPATADGDQDPANGAPCDGIDADKCMEGNRVCMAGMLACTDPNDNDAEICNGIDDDCDPATADGSSDPGVGVACDGADPGACTDGTQQCTGGMLVCNDPADVEQCNALDENCNGIINDGVAGCGTCAMPHPIPSGGFTGTYQMSGSSTTSGSCGGNGLDRYHVFVPANSGTATIQVVTDYWPSVVYVRQGTCTGSQVVCDYKAGPWPTNMLSFAVTAGTTYYIITDHGTYNGPIVNTYTLTVTAP